MSGFTFCSSAPLEIHQRRQPRRTQFFQCEAQGVLWRGRPLRTHALPWLHRLLIAPDNLPTTVFTLLERAPELLPVGAHHAIGCSADRRLQCEVDHFTSKSLKILLIAQRPVYPRRGNLKAPVVNRLDFKDILQLPRDPLTVFHRDRRARHPWTPGKIDGDTQQSACGALHLDQVITQSTYGIVYGLLKCHSNKKSLPAVQKTTGIKKGPVETRPGGRELWLFYHRACQRVPCGRTTSPACSDPTR